MTNQPFSQFIQRQLADSQRTLFIADENVQPQDLEAIAGATALDVLTNRYDLYDRLRQQGYRVHFNDFDLRDYSEVFFDNLLYPVSKERAVVHHLINQAPRILTDNGALLMWGHKQQGIQTHIKRLRAYFNQPVDEIKHKQYRLAMGRPAPQLGEHLDDNDYDRLRPIQTSHGTFHSKPGLFGWNKEDKGSRVLIDTLIQQHDRDRWNGRRLLDIGCGYGYLSVLAQRHFGFHQITATDTNAAAVLACRHNFQAFNMPGQVIATHVGEGVGGPFDLILCNPPFHQGFQTESRLSRDFLEHSRRLLAPKGEAWFVVNQFLPADSIALEYFRSVEEVVRVEGFKVLRMT